MKRGILAWRVFLPVLTAFCVSVAFTSCGKKKEQVQSKPPQVEQQQTEQAEHPTENPAADTGGAEHPTEHPTADSGQAEQPAEHPEAQDK